MTKIHKTPLRARFGRRAAVVGSVLVAALLGTVVPAAAAPPPPNVTAAPLDLYAVKGSTTLPDGSSVPVLGYSTTTGATVTAPGGPVLTVTQGTPVTIKLHSEIGEATSLVVRGQSMPTDLVGTDIAGGVATYTFTPTEPGTFIYEAGPMANTQHQTAMGLHGALAVIPSTLPVDYPAHEAAVVISEIDPALNGAANPAAFDMRNFKPKYTLFNGTAYPSGTPVLTTAQPGETVLLRYVNAGISYHSMSVLGTNQRIVADDGHALAQPYSVVAQTVGPGQSTDAVITVPALAGAGTMLSVFDANLQLRNKGRKPGQSSSPTAGGAVGFIQVAGAAPGTDTLGPVASNLKTVGGADLLPTPGDSNRTYLTATISDATTGGATILAARYWVNNGSTDGPKYTMTLDPASGAVTATASANFLNLTGSNTVYVEGQDSNGNWGLPASISVSTDTQPPVVNPVVITPTATNGQTDPQWVATNGKADAKCLPPYNDPQNPNVPQDPSVPAGTGPDCPLVSVRSSASDVGRGDSNIAMATYRITDTSIVSPNDPIVFTRSMNFNNTATTVSLDGFIRARDIALLNDGKYLVSVTATDTAVPANTGISLSLPPVWLTVDRVGPAVTLATPKPSNGKVGLNSSVNAVRITGTAKDELSATLRVEGFIDPTLNSGTPVVTDGTGFIFLPTDGTWNAPSGKNDLEAIYSDIPLATINTLADGAHTVYVHAKDAAGNWGPWQTTILTVDRTPPTLAGTTITRAGPSPVLATSVAFTVTFNEAVVGVSAANFSLVNGTGFSGGSIISVTGSGATRTVTVATGFSGGTVGLNLTSVANISDIAGNAMTASGLPVVGEVYTMLTPPLYFSTLGNSLPPGVAGTADDADIYLWNDPSFSRVIDASGTGSLGLPSGANVDGFDRVDDTHFYMSFTNQVNVPGIGNVQDEDVVYYNAGTWSLWFDGSNPLNVVGTPTVSVGNTDLDAISIVGGTLYFSTDNTAVPTGAGGSGDDADIYSWNGTSFTRVIDASARGWSRNNVDGLVFVDVDHVYLSYSDSTTNVPGIGNIQDEDVVYYGLGSWSVYFDGTSKGLTSNNNNTAGNLDVDAFDIP